MTLDQLRPGERGVVAAMGASQTGSSPQSEATSRLGVAALTRLGLRPGTEVLCRRRVPLGGPTVYRFRGTDLALRDQDAATIVLLDRRADGSAEGGGRLRAVPASPCP